MDYDKLSLANTLIAFERSGVIRDAFRLIGLNAVSCDLEPSESDHHIQADAIVTIQSRQWDLVIMHPVCTALSVSGNHRYAKGKPAYQDRLDAISYIKQLWKIAIRHANRVCLENPQGVIHTMTDLPKPQYIQPYQFGDDASKKTGLTLYRLPLLIPTKRIAGRIVSGVERWANQCDSGQNKLGPSPDRSQKRAETYSGIANAMAEQWGKLINEL